jgi:hypothetical protein
VNVTETQPNHYAISYLLTFVQNTNHHLTTTIENEEVFLDDTGLCHIPLLTLYTQCGQVLAAATTGETFRKGCEAIVDHVLAQCHDSHFAFVKWFVEPGTANFFVMPDTTLGHTTGLLTSLLEDIMPTNYINIANQINPLSTHWENHSDRPLLRVVLGLAYRNNRSQHDQIWNITLHLINATQTHPNWSEHSTHHPGSRTTDTSASSTTVTRSGPTTAKGPPTNVVPTPAIAKPSPPQPPGEGSFQA